jgi:chromosome condensin MukBEF MukE localization factor
MSELPLYSDQVMKQEQYQDLLREAEHHRLIKAATQSEPEPPQNIDSARRRTLLDRVRRLASLGSLGPART